MPSSGHLWGRRLTIVCVAAGTPSRMGPLLQHFTWDHRRLVARAAGNAPQLQYLPAALPANVASGLTGYCHAHERHRGRVRHAVKRGTVPAFTRGAATAIAPLHHRLHGSCH